jgi:hypothetical protein
MAWKRAGLELLEPVLLEYETATILRKAVVARWLTTAPAVEAMGSILGLNICWLTPTAYVQEQALCHGTAHRPTWQMTQGRKESTMPLTSQQQDIRLRLGQADASQPGARFTYARMLGRVEVGHPGLDEGDLEMSPEDFNALVDHGVLQLVNDFQYIMTRSD